MPTTEVRLPVEHVSDTAYMVALFRAIESERADAKFKDPYARLLASPKAQALEAAVPFKETGHWLMTVRTCLLDEQILALISKGVDTVVNLAAGLDTRPYRLALPSELRWFEADFPGITQYKTERLAAETPRCRLERIALDLSDDNARRAMLTRIDSGARRTLVITEGLLPYLSEANVRALAEDLHRLPSVTGWLMDVATPGFLQWAAKRWKADAKEGSVVMRFAPPEGIRYFESLGWKIAGFDSFLDGSQ